MMFRHSLVRAASIGLLGTAVCAPLARAQLLIDPSGGTVLSSVNDDDASYGGRSLGFTGNFFGVARTTVDVSSNGNLNFSGNTDFSNGPMPTSVARISPMWDDLYVYNAQSITESVSPGNYYAVTYQIGTFAFGHVFHQCQVVWFGAATTIRGFQFQPDDIVFCYETVGASPWTATVGLDAGDGTNFVSLPGDADGSISDADAGLLPVYPSSSRVILFRPIGNTYLPLQILTNSKCEGDFNHDGVVNSQDFFDFLVAFFAGC